jgi:hypothetical protein
MNGNRPKPKFHCGLLRNLSQLVLGHFAMCFVIDSLDFTPILAATDNPSKINCRACSGIQSILWRVEWRFCD